VKRYDPGPFFARLSAVGMSRSELAGRLGCNVSTIALWARKGVGENYADQAAVAVGVTPGCLWPEWIDDEIERLEADRRRVQAERQRQLKAKNPEYAERQRAYARRYKAENATYIKAQYRAYYAANRDRIIQRVKERRQEEKAS
jgi:transcriptional regulator with XRE-family HTH domain